MAQGNAQMKKHPKLIDKINKRIQEGKPFFSFEYFPPKTDEGLTNLYLRFDRMGALGPLFIDITWSAGGQKAKKADITLEIAATAQEICCLDCNVHLTCNTMTKQQVLEVLNKCKALGLHNILALRGDPVVGVEQAGDFKYAADLVRFIRQNFGDHFCVSVAGYPYLHADCPDYNTGIQHLKMKVDEGADFVVSQLFFEADHFLHWVRDCRDAGVNCPIIPGILPIQSYVSLRNMTKMCATQVPQYIVDSIELIKDDDAAIREFGIKYAVEVGKKLVEAGVPGLHFYTLNREVATERIIIELSQALEKVHRPLPWKKPPTQKREAEDVRPIYWCNRSKSYISRTAVWDEFPNGRWGDARSPAYGELTDYHLFLHAKQQKPEELRKMWGEELQTEGDCSTAFVKFLKGEIGQLPWIDDPISIETVSIKQNLIRMNEKGLWTINSQPRVNAAPSDDPSVGWGGPGGWVFQKAYVEFFASRNVLNILLKVFEENSLRINYQAVNVNGDEHSNTNKALAVTWGVFPGLEIIQPTIVDPVSFKVWKDEAFALWKAKWAAIYPPESTSRAIINHIHDTYYLVNMVDNDFVKGDIWEVIYQVLQQIQ